MHAVVCYLNTGKACSSEWVAIIIIIIIVIPPPSTYLHIYIFIYRPARTTRVPNPYAKAHQYRERVWLEKCPE